MRRRPLALALLPLLAALLALGAPPAAAKLDAAEWKEAEAKFKTLFAETGETEAKGEVLRLLAKDGEPRAFRLFAEGMVLEAAHVAKIAKAHEEKAARWAQLLAMKYAEMRPADQEELVRVQSDARYLERAKQAEEKLLDVLVGLAVEGGPDLRKGMIQKAKGHSDWAVRAAAARIAGATVAEPVSKAYLQQALEKDKDARVRISGLEGLQKAEGKDWHALLVPRLEDPEWSVRVLAARIAGEREVGRAIPGLIEALGKSDPRTAEEMAGALRRLTGQNFDAAAEVWAKWWADHRGEFGEDGRPLAPVKEGPSAKDVEFYGLRVKAERVVFVVDMSGSMKLPLDPPKAGAAPTTGAEGAAADVGKIKIDVARRELKRGLESLPKSATFNVIAFNHNVTAWQPQMQAATPEARTKAYEWFAAMEPSGSTFIDGALAMAFRMAGVGSYDAAYGVAIDTVIALTDGAPTDNGWPDAQNMDPEEILTHVREWNARQLVKIHCVGIDRVHGIEFLKKLAAQNGGTYVDG
jgi:hypothetical protein